MGHVADERLLRLLALGRLLFAPGPQRRSVVGVGVEDLGRFFALAQPKMGVGPERGEVVPETVGHPAGAEDHPFFLVFVEKLHGSQGHGVGRVEQLSGEHGVAEGPLAADGVDAFPGRHQNRQIEESAVHGLGVALSGLLECGPEILELGLPIGELGHLQAPGRIHRGFQAGQAPIDVGVLGDDAVDAAVGKARRDEARFERGLNHVDAVAERIEDHVARIGRRHDAAEQQRLRLLRRMRLLAVLALRPGGLEPRRIPGQKGVAGQNVEDDAVLLPIVAQDVERSVRLLAGQQMLDAGARFLAAAQVGHRFEDEGAVHDPQAAIAGGADLEDRQPVLDFAGLVDVPDAGVEEALHGRIGHSDDIVGEIAAGPIAGGPFRLGLGPGGIDVAGFVPGRAIDGQLFYLLGKGHGQLVLGGGDACPSGAEA